EGAVAPPARAIGSRWKALASAPSPRACKSCRRWSLTSRLPREARAECRRRHDTHQERTRVAAALHEGSGERLDGGQLDGGRRATERVANPLLGRAVVNDLAARECLRERNAPVEGAVHVRLVNGSGRVDGESIIGRVPMAGRVVI